MTVLSVTNLFIIPLTGIFSGSRLFLGCSEMLARRGDLGVLIQEHAAKQKIKSCLITLVLCNQTET